MNIFARDQHPSDPELIAHQNRRALRRLSSWRVSLHVLSCAPCRDRLHALPPATDLPSDDGLQARIDAIRRRLLDDIGESRTPAPPSELAREVTRDLLGERFASNLNEGNWAALERQLGVFLGHRSTLMLKRKLRSQSCHPQS